MPNRTLRITFLSAGIVAALAALFFHFQEKREKEELAEKLKPYHEKEKRVVAMLAERFKPLHDYDAYQAPDAPDYTDPTSWASLPTIEDPADNPPKDTGLIDQQGNAQVDVFYVHPTTYLNKEAWSADVDSDIKIGRFDPLHTQASVFNGSAKIYAPKYRQATLFSFFDDSPNAKMALGVAQGDIIRAFIHYLAYYNEGRPFIIAGHSQGSKLLITILQFLEKYPTDKFITAYIPGWTISTDDFTTLKPCNSPTELQCFNVWNAKKWGSKLEDFVTTSRYLDSDCVNPLSWKNDEVEVSEEEHLGAVNILGLGLDKNYVKAKCHGEMLWVELPENPAYESKMNKLNYHLVDFGLFYMNVRENIKQRIDAYNAIHSTP